MRKETRISGFGGQGVILAGYILGKAASIYAGLSAVQTQSYGPAARGGLCKSDVIISDEPIRYPRVSNADYLVLMSQQSYDKFSKRINDSGGVVIIEKKMVTPTDEDKTYFRQNDILLYEIAAIEKAEEIGKRIVANMVMLGALCAITGILDLDTLKKAIDSTVSSKVANVNHKALDEGYTLGLKAKDETS